MMKDARTPVYVVFHGDCLLCHWFVRRLFFATGVAGFWFVPSGSQAGEILGQRVRDASLFSRSVVVIAGGELLAEEDALCFLLKHTRGFYALLRVVCVFSRWFLRRGYRFVARNRGIFSAHRSCPVPSGLVQSRMVVTSIDLAMTETTTGNSGPELRTAK